MPPIAESEEPDVSETSGETALSCDSYPPGIREAARAAFEWRAPGAELAELTYDSLMDDPAPPARASRLLRWESADVTIEIEVGDVGARRRLSGRVLPPQPSGVTVRHPNTSEDTEADAKGRFQMLGVSPGPVSLLCRLPSSDGERLVETEWVTL